MLQSVVHPRYSILSYLCPCERHKEISFRYISNGRYGLTYSLINLTRTLSIGEGDDGGVIVRKRKVIEEASTQRQNIYL
jgi:hypothetical protein